MQEKPSYYAILPANIRYDKDLRASEKLLYAEITTLTSKNGCCWASNDYFSKLYNVSKQAISLWVNNLKRKGYINVTYTYKEDSKEIDKRCINININYVSTNIGGVSTNIGGVSTNFDGGYQQILKENNTSINNILNNNSLHSLLFNYIWQQNLSCECLTKNNEVCTRKATYQINGKNYCNQHSKPIISKLLTFTCEEPSNNQNTHYGEFNNVILSNEELNKLKEKFPNDYDKRIENLSSYIQSTGKKYKNHYATILLWARKESNQNQNNKDNKPSVNLVKDKYGGYSLV